MVNHFAIDHQSNTGTHDILQLQLTPPTQQQTTIRHHRRAKPLAPLLLRLIPIEPSHQNPHTNQPAFMTRPKATMQDPFARIGTTTTQPNPKHWQHLWENGNHITDDDNTQDKDDKQRSQYSEDQLDFVKAKLHPNMNQLFEQYGTKLEAALAAQEVGEFLRLWTTIFEQAILTTTQTPKNQHRHYTNRHETHITHQKQKWSGQYSKHTNSILPPTMTKQAQDEHARLHKQSRRLSAMKDIARMLHRHNTNPAPPGKATQQAKASA